MENAKDHKPAEAFRMTGDWVSQSKQLKSTYPQLTDEDLKFESGKENDLLNRVGKRLSKNRDEVVGIVKKVQPVRAL